MIFSSNSESTRTKPHLKLKGISEEKSTGHRKTNNKCSRNQFRLMSYSQTFHKWLLKELLTSLVNLDRRIRASLIKQAKIKWMKWVVIKIACPAQQLVVILIKDLLNQNKISFKRLFQETQIGMKVLKVPSNRICWLVSFNMLPKLPWKAAGQLKHSWLLKRAEKNFSNKSKKNTLLFKKTHLWKKSSKLSRKTTSVILLNKFAPKIKHHQPTATGKKLLLT